MIAGSAICERAICEAPPASSIYSIAASVVGIATTALAMRANILLAAAASGIASVSFAPQRGRPLAASALGSAVTSLVLTRFAVLAASVTGIATALAGVSFVIRFSASVIGTASAFIDTSFRLFVSTREFITRLADSPSETPFYATIQKALHFERSIALGPIIGGVTAAWGVMKLINADRRYDRVTDRYSIGGRRVCLKLGAAGRPYSEFVTLFDGTASGWFVNEETLDVDLRDNAYKLEVPAQPNVYAGTGGLEGGVDLEGKRKPRALGATFNVLPPEVIPAEKVYQINDGPVEAITAVYDSGVELTFAGNYATSTLLRAATTGAAGSGAAIEAGEYATCLAEGLIRTGGATQGQLTADVQGDKTGGTYVETAADIIRRLIESAPEIVDPDDISEVSFDQLNLIQPATINYWLPPDGEETIADVVANIMGTLGGWGGFRRSGRFEVALFTAPTGMPTARYGKIDITSIFREPLPDSLNPPPWRFRVAWGRNWTQQTPDQLADSVEVGVERVAFLKDAYRLATSNAASGAILQTNYPLAQDPPPVESYFDLEDDARDEANRLLALFTPTAALYRYTVKSQPFVHEIGDVTELTYPRWDLSDGRLLRTVSLKEDTDENSVEIVGFG